MLKRCLEMEKWLGGQLRWVLMTDCISHAWHALHCGPTIVIFFPSQQRALHHG
jgi:hypothetical protein